MSTGNFENWTGVIADMGAIYPFVGTETLLALAGLAFWIGWHIKQISQEKSELAEAEKILEDKSLLEAEIRK